jgi:hypothetical protein
MRRGRWRGGWDDGAAIRASVRDRTRTAVRQVSMGYFGRTRRTLHGQLQLLGRRGPEQRGFERRHVAGSRRGSPQMRAQFKTDPVR